MILEKQIEKQILNWLNLQPDIFAFKINTVGIYDVKQKLFRQNRNPHVHLGTSDILGICRGLFFCIEVKTTQSLKRASSSPTRRDVNQMRFIQKVAEKGGDGIRTTNLESVIQFIMELRKKKLV